MKELIKSREGCFLSSDQICALFTLATGLCMGNEFISSIDLINKTYALVHTHWDKIIQIPEDVRFSCVVTLMKDIFYNQDLPQKNIESIDNLTPHSFYTNFENSIFSTNHADSATKSVPCDRTATIISLHLKGLTFNQIIAEMETMQQSSSLCEEEDNGN